MPYLPRSFRTRLERRLVLLFFGFCVLPLVVLTAATVRLIETQTLAAAQRHLAEHAKTYAMHLIDRLDVARWELGQAVHRADGAGAFVDGDAWRWVTPLSAEPVPAGTANTVGQPRLKARAGGFELEVVSGGLRLTGLLRDDVLFEDLQHAPFGVRSCVRVGDELRRCAGPEPVDAAIRAHWSLPLASLYDTDLVIDVIAIQPKTVALRYIGVLYRVLPYLVFAIMAIAAWWVLAQLRARFAPVAELREATLRVQEGDYAHRVDIRSGDELERLGDAFNDMTGRLQQSFGIMQTLAEMDHMVLNGAQLEDLVRQALILLDDIGLTGGLVWLWDGDGKSDVYRLGGQQRLEICPARLPVPVEATEGAALAVLQSGACQAVGLSAPVMQDGTLCGLIACAGEGETSAHRDVLVELGDRVSVALTLLGRASELFQRAHYDALTGLLNREAFSERLGRAARMSAREQTMGALICLDLDRFKQVNDTAGHDIGDRLLCQVAERLRAAVRVTDEVARLGGDEFAVLVPRVDDTAEVEMLCRRLIAELGRPLTLAGNVHTTEASFGIVVFPDDGDDVPALLRKADVAMYEAKEQSGSAFAFFDAETNRRMVQRAHTESRLRQGLRARELRLHFQPKIRVSDGRVVGVEGLLRWPAMRDMHPGIFIPVAEQTGLIHEFTRILVEDGKQCLDRCRDAGFDIQRVGVNVSPRQFQRPAFADEFLDLLARSRAHPGDFEIEVTESVFVRNPEAVARDLETLRAAGVSVALDDFGTGYSSLNVLRELPLDVIKIDRSFVSPISGSKQAQDFLGRIIDLIRSLELTSVAEGVETDREMQILTAQQCDIVQGYLFSPALPVPALLDFLGQRHRIAALG